jgi:SulP family sulfate permease
VTGIVVAITLLFLTPLLYNLPQATLAAIIVMAVINLVKIEPIMHAMKVQKHDGMVAIITFALTLIVAPHLEEAIVVGVVLSLGLYLYRTMRPRFAELALHPDGTLRDVDVHNLPRNEAISVLRFDGSLYFANAGYFEDKVLANVALKPKLKYVIIDAEGINQIDATGEEMLHVLSQRLKAAGIQFMIARAKKQLMDIFRATHFVDHLGEKYFFRTRTDAIHHARAQLGEQTVGETVLS